MGKLKKNNIYCNILYPFPIHLMRGYSYLKYKKGEEHRTQLVIVNYFKEVFNIGSGYDGKCKLIK